MHKKTLLTLAFMLLTFPSLAQPKLVETSWEEIHRSVAEMCLKLDGEKVDVLLGVAVGGIIPTALFSNHLGNKNVLTISVSSRDNKNQQRELFIRNKPEKKYLEGKNVLVVDDILDSGATMIAIKKLLEEEYNVKSLQVATVFLNTEHCRIHPDYWGIETTDWIIFPWEKREN